MEGRGVYTWPDGKRYDGEYKADQMEGRGLCTLADGRAFEGFFKGDMPVSGQMVELDGGVFQGQERRVGWGKRAGPKGAYRAPNTGE
jgi:hypothetical protein